MEPRGYPSSDESHLLFLPSTHDSCSIADPPFVPGGGTASSATQMLRSKDVLFQRTGVSRLMTVLAAPGGVQLVAAAVENNGAADALVRIVSNASVPTAPKKWWFTRRRVPRVPSQQGADPGADTAVVSRREARVACAEAAANALRKMAARWV